MFDPMSISGIDFQKIFNDFIAWLQTNQAEDTIFRFLLASVLLTGIYAIFKLYARAVFNYLISIFSHRKNLSETYGTYYMYHKNLIIELDNGLLRVAKIHVKRGFFSAAKIKQTDANDTKHVLYKGSLKKEKTFYSIYMNPINSDGDKTIILWHFQDTKSANKIAVGIMTAVNFQLDPYGVPIIIARNTVDITAIEEVFRVIEKNYTINRETRREVFNLLDSAPTGAAEDVFEHMRSPRGPIIENQGKMQRIKSVFTKYRNSKPLNKFDSVIK